MATSSGGVATFVVTEGGGVATKSLVLRVRVTSALMALLEADARREGVCISELVRARLEGRSFADVDRDVERVMDGVARKFEVSVPRPSASQVAKRSFTPDFK